MINIKYAFQGLYKKWVFTLFTIIEFVACIVLLYIVLSTSHFIKAQTEKVEGIFNNKIIYSLKQNNAKIDSDYSSEQLKNFDQYLENNKEFKSIQYQSGGLYIQKFNEVSNFLRNTVNKAIEEKTMDNVKFSYVHCSEINKSFSEEFPLRLERGRFFSAGDFTISKDKDIPVVLGNSYSKIFKLGSEIEYINLEGNSSNTGKLKVIGFLDKDVYFTTSFNFSISENMDDLSNYIIFPKQTEDSDLFFKISNNLIAVNNTGTNKASLEKEIIDKGSQNGFDISLVSAQAGIADFQNENKTNENLINFAAIGAVASLLIFMLQTIIRRFREFGIHIMQGVAITDIAKRIFYEMVIIVMAYYLLFLSNEDLINFAAIVILVFTIASLLTIMLQTIIRRYREFGIHIMQGPAITDIAKRIFYEMIIIVTASYLISLSVIINLFKKIAMLEFNWIVFKQLTLILIILTIVISIIPIISVLKFQVKDLVRGNE